MTKPQLCTVTIPVVVLKMAVFQFISTIPPTIMQLDEFTEIFELA
jgi:hypothetical protein